MSVQRLDESADRAGRGLFALAGTIWGCCWCPGGEVAWRPVSGARVRQRTGMTGYETVKGCAKPVNMA